MPTRHIGWDCGQGLGKLASGEGTATLASYASTAGAHFAGEVAGLGTVRPYMTIRPAAGRGLVFHVGPHAHSVGTPVESVDFDRYGGTPEQRALLYGLLTEYQRRHEVRFDDDRVKLTVGVPLSLLRTNEGSEEVESNVQGIKEWLKGSHAWEADGERFQLHVSEVVVNSQAAGALFYYLCDATGKFNRARLADLKGQVGVLSLGFATLEAMVVEQGSGQLQQVGRFTQSDVVGVHRLLQILNPEQHWTLAEMDERLRGGKLDIGEGMEVWKRAVSNSLFGNIWKDNVWRRFTRVIIVGGGALQLGPWLLERFGAKAFLPTERSNGNGNEAGKLTVGNEPITAIAQGLYRQSLRGA